MKTRIKRTVTLYHSGRTDTDYVIQRRLLWFFWVNYRFLKVYYACGSPYLFTKHERKSVGIKTWEEARYIQDILESGSVCVSYLDDACPKFYFIDRDTTKEIDPEVYKNSRVSYFPIFGETVAEANEKYIKYFALWNDKKVSSKMTTYL